MILITGATGTVGRRIAFHLLHAGTAVRSSTRGPDSAGLLGSVGDDIEQRIDPVIVRIAARLAA